MFRTVLYYTLHSDTLYCTWSWWEVHVIPTHVQRSSPAAWFPDGLHCAAELSTVFHFFPIILSSNLASPHVGSGPDWRWWCQLPACLPACLLMDFLTLQLPWALLSSPGSSLAAGPLPGMHMDWASHRSCRLMVHVLWRRSDDLVQATSTSTSTSRRHQRQTLRQALGITSHACIWQSTRSTTAKERSWLFEKTHVTTAKSPQWSQAVLVVAERCNMQATPSILPCFIHLYTPKRLRQRLRLQILTPQSSPHVKHCPSLSPPLIRWSSQPILNSGLTCHLPCIAFDLALCVPCARRCLDPVVSSSRPRCLSIQFPIPSNHFIVSSQPGL